MALTFSNQKRLQSPACLQVTSHVLNDMMAIREQLGGIRAVKHAGSLQDLASQHSLHFRYILQGRYHPGREIYKFVDLVLCSRSRIRSRMIDTRICTDALRSSLHALWKVRSGFAPFSLVLRFIFFEEIKCERVETRAQGFQCTIRAAVDDRVYLHRYISTYI